MMAKFYGRSVLKQFIKGKPIRFGLKFWGLCTVDGYLLDFDLYCGQNAPVGNKLAKCTLGSRVVMTLLEDFFKSVPFRKLPLYHLYMDNFFTSFDLFLHLKKLRLRTTGTIQELRVPKDMKNVVDAKADRGSFAVKHERNSGLNYITVKDSKVVSMASTLAGVTPTQPMKRYSSEASSKVDIPFPNVFSLYNKFMGGVDLHDSHCNNVMPGIRSKKWTWVVFIRLIQSAITNATVISNRARVENKKKAGTKQFMMDIARQYLDDHKSLEKQHDIIRTEKQRACSIDACPTRTRFFCKTCNHYFCKTCLNQYHMQT